MQETNTKPRYIYAICDKRTGEVINRKCQSGNPYYSKKGLAENKIFDLTIEEVITYQLIKIENK